MAKNVAKKFAIGTAVAAGVGYVAGVLTAPKSGKETRADIKHATEKVTGDAEKKIKKMHADLDKLVNEAKAKGGKATGKAKSEVDKLLNVAYEAKEKAAGLVDAVRKDKSTDKELQKAIADANKAIDHLRTYLKK